MLQFPPSVVDRPALPPVAHRPGGFNKRAFLIWIVVLVAGTYGLCRYLEHRELQSNIAVKRIQLAREAESRGDLSRALYLYEASLSHARGQGGKPGEDLRGELEAAEAKVADLTRRLAGSLHRDVVLSRSSPSVDISGTTLQLGDKAGGFELVYDQRQLFSIASRTVVEPQTATVDGLLFAAVFVQIDDAGREVSYGGVDGVRVHVFKH